jgi:uncharacterized protein YjbI with pentapeptide repeats
MRPGKNLTALSLCALAACTPLLDPDAVTFGDASNRDPLTDAGQDVTDPFDFTEDFEIDSGDDRPDAPDNGAALDPSFCDDYERRGALPDSAACRLEPEGICSGQELEGADLSCLRLDGINLFDSHMEEALFRFTSLRDATLYEADIDGADFQGADLQGAVLHDARMASTDLRGADLTDAVMYSADLSRADLRGATLLRTTLYEARLLSATLSSTQLRDVNLNDADLSDATLERADVQGGDLNGAIFWNARMMGVTMRGVDLRDANLLGADLRASALTGVDLRGADLTGADLTGAVWLDTTCPDGTSTTQARFTCDAHREP